jgi:hypothetical protein
MVSEHAEAIQRYPLQWPIGWKRTPAVNRGRADFRMTRFDDVIKDNQRVKTKRTTPINMAVATKRLERQLDMLGAADAVLSSNVQLRLDGRPRGDENPGDPGAAVYFRFRARATVLACDRYQRVADNIAAIANHIDALRRIERYGVGTIEQALAGYKALPADSAADWRAVFGFRVDEPVSVDAVQRAFKQRAMSAHPDRGGTEDAMAHLNRARDFALQELLS